MTEQKLLGKVALITGGAQRAGKTFSLDLAKEGADIVFTYWKTEEDAIQTKKEIEALGRRCMAVEGDIADTNAMRKLVDDIEKEFGRLDVLIHNAANYNTDPFFDVSEEHFDSSMNIILRGPFFLSQAAAKLMLKNKSGKIITLVGNSYFETWPEKIPHAIAKTGMVKLMEGLAVALSPYVQCYSVCPASFCKVDKNEYIAEYDDEFHVVNGIPFRNGDVNAVSELVVYLATCTNYLNGSVIKIDGGKHLMCGVTFPSQRVTN